MNVYLRVNKKPDALGDGGQSEDEQEMKKVTIQTRWILKDTENCLLLIWRNYKVILEHWHNRTVLNVTWQSSGYCELNYLQQSRSKTWNCETWMPQMTSKRLRLQCLKLEPTWPISLWSHMKYVKQLRKEIKDPTSFKDLLDAKRQGCGKFRMGGSLSQF